MQRLKGGDAAFLYVESSAWPVTQPSTPLYVALLRPGTGPGGAPQPLTPAALRAHIEGRLPALAPLRRRLRKVPFGLHHPVWIDDPDFDLDDHLRHVTLGSGGGGADPLDHLLADLAARPLDRRLPLWQATLVDGLAAGHQALVFCFHHAMADGVAAMGLLTALLADSGPDGGRDGGEDAPWRPERPGPLRLLAGSLRDHLRAWGRMPSLLRATLRGRAAVAARRSAAAVDVPLQARGARPCSLNDSFTAARVHARTGVPLADVHRVKTAAGVTFNEVVLAMVAGALTSYLGARGERPVPPLVATVPVALDPPDAPARVSGNRVMNVMTSLATHIDDPWTRLGAISACVREARTQLDLRGPDTLARWVEYVPPVLAEPGMRIATGSLRARRDRCSSNVLVSSPRGPASPWSFGSTTVERLWCSGPLFDGVGVNVTVVPYGDELALAVRSNPDALDDPDELAARCVRALDELLLLAAADPADRGLTPPSGGPEPAPGVPAT